MTTKRRGPKPKRPKKKSSKTSQKTTIEKPAVATHRLVIELDAPIGMRPATVRNAVAHILNLGEAELQEIIDDTGDEEVNRLAAAEANLLNICEPQPEDHTKYRLARSILDAFQESSLYDDYKSADGWTDEEFDTLMRFLDARQRPYDGDGDEPTFHICQNCQQLWEESQLVNPIPDLYERVAPGEPMPSGECPVKECGALCQQIFREDEVR